MPDRRGVSYGKRPRADGRWQGYVALAGGKRRTVIRPTEVEMRADVDRLAAQRDEGRAPSTTDPTLTAYLTRWIEQRRDGTIGRRKLAPSSVIRYERIARLQIAPIIGSIRLSRLRAEHLDGLMDTLRRGGESGNARQHAYRLLHVALRHAERRGLVARNPCIYLDAPARDTVQDRELDTADVTAILTAAKGHPLEAFLWMGIATGARSGELLALRWSDVALDTGRLTISRKVLYINGIGQQESGPKTAAGVRTMALPRVAVDMLRAHLARQRKAGRPNPRDLIFPSARGTHLSESNWRRDTWIPWKEAAGIDPGTPFRALTRKAHASLLVSLGVDRETLRHRVGHTSTVTTDAFYVQTVSGADEEAARKLDRALRDLASPAPKKGRRNRMG